MIAGAIDAASVLLNAAAALVPLPWWFRSISLGDAMPDAACARNAFDALLRRDDHACELAFYCGGVGSCSERCLLTPRC